MEALIVALVLCGAVICEGCHQASEVEPENDWDRKKREVAREPYFRKDLSDYFTACMTQKCPPGVVPVMRSVIDFVLRDSEWYKVSDEFLCDFRQGKDNVGCWNSVIDLLIDWDSVMLGPARECLLAYGKDPRSITFLGGYRSKRTISDFSDSDKLCPNVSDSTFEDCIGLEVNNTMANPSLITLDWESITTFAREHLSRCRFEKFVQHWDGKTAYRRKCAQHRFSGANGERVETAQQQCLPVLFDGVVKEESPLKSAITACNELYSNATGVVDDSVADDELPSLTPDFPESSTRGKNDGKGGTQVTAQTLP